MANKKNEKTNANEEVVETLETTVKDEVAPEAEPIPTIGIVTNCSKLNVRKKPNKKADVVTVINVKTQVVIDEEASTKDWYKVTVNGINGFCMRNFISVR